MTKQVVDLRTRIAADRTGCRRGRIPRIVLVQLKVKNLF